MKRHVVSQAQPALELWAKWTTPVLLLIAALIAALTVAANAQVSAPWRELPALPQAVGGHFVGVSGDRLIVAGGSYWQGTPWDADGRKIYADRIYALRRGAAAWDEVGRLPHGLAHGACVTIPRGLVCIGGEDAERTYADVFLLACVDGKFTRRDLPPLPQAASKLAAAALGGTIYVSGGQTERDATAALATVNELRLDDPQPVWRALPHWPGPARIYHTMAADERGVFVISGNAVTATPDGKQRRIFLLDAFRYSGGAWTALTPLRDPVAAASAYAERGCLLVFGGDHGFYAPRDAELREQHPGFAKAVLALDDVDRGWRKVADFPTGQVITAAVRWGDELIIAGGEDRPGHRVTTVLAAPVAALLKGL